MPSAYVDAAVEGFYEAAEKRQAALPEDERLYALFYANWCPDCHRALPILEAAFARLSHTTVLRCDVGTREAWRKPAFPLRIDKRLNVVCVPTLLRWSKEGPRDRLDDAQCQDAAAVDKFVGLT
eukprot:jgi/Chlat1/7064/Chrsp56S06724